MAAQQEEIDSLKSLEDRIARAVDLVVELRRQNQQLTQNLEALKADRDQARAEAQSLQAQIENGRQEVEELRSERKQVRTRIEKLLGQMDLLSAQ
ncbi:MAG: cell division protein ZapB [Acidobacteria bacterium]|nr:cell division protein ZapB [Acidobacteriota bacterium]